MWLQQWNWDIRRVWKLEELLGEITYSETRQEKDWRQIMETSSPVRNFMEYTNTDPWSSAIST